MLTLHHRLDHGTTLNDLLLDGELLIVRGRDNDTRLGRGGHFGYRLRGV